MRLHHTVTGSGPALLFLHSIVCDGRQWDCQRVLATERTVVTVDLRGFGRSPLPPEPYSDARDVLDVLDHLGVRSTAVVGSSGGGHVALQLASTVPDRVTSLVLLCAAGPDVEPTPDLLAFAEQERSLLEDGDIAAATELNVRTWLGPEADEETRQSLRVMQRQAFTVQLAAGDAAEEQPFAIELDAVTARTTVVSGDHDLDYFAAVADHLATRIAGARRVELPWAGHLPNLERPLQTTELIGRALDGDAARPRRP